MENFTTLYQSVSTEEMDYTTQEALREEELRNVFVFRPGQMIVLPVLIVLGLIGNLLVSISVFKITKLRTVANYYIVSLAVSDTLVCGVIMPLALYQEINGGKWELGGWICDVWVSMDVLMSTASIWNLCLISTDRFLAITRPIWYAKKRTSLSALIAIAAAWALSIVLSVPALIFVGGYDPAISTECVLIITPIFAIISSLISFYIPCVIVLIVYYHILKAARKHSRRRVAPIQSATARTAVTQNNTQGTTVPTDASRVFTVQQEPPGGNCSHNDTSDTPDTPNNVTADDNNNSINVTTTNNNGNSVTTTNDNSNKVTTVNTNGNNVTFSNSGNNNPPIRPQRRPANNDYERISVARERRAAIVLAIVVGVFIICWLPFFFINVLLGICTNCYVSIFAFQVVTWLGWCNSVANPAIYTIFNKEFRNAFRRILFCGKL